MNSADNQATILVVDDTPENIDVLDGILRPDYKIKAALNGIRALKICRSTMPPDLVLLDIMMPDMDGYEVCRQLKADPLTRQIPVIFVTAKSEVADETKGFALGGVDYITKPVSPPIVQARVATQLALYDQNRTLEHTVRKRTTQLEETRLEIIRRLGRAAEYKDNETGLHVIRMSHYARILAQGLGMEAYQVNLIFQAAAMHDIGKIGIPDSILLKPAKLTDEERAEMCKHPEIGEEIIGKHDADLLETARIISLTHHEKWDGSGYPNGLKGESIPLYGRICAIADVFDALTTVRPYKKAWTIEEAVAELQKDAGSHFDPKLVPVFIDHLEEILTVRDQFLDN
ncbi:MAG: two-component system response regulator [Magnetococcales bacterium]|nr:two-component system response regulator [Magnetococcales bacterium]